MLEQLPVEIMTHVLAYMSIVDRIKLARGNSALQQRVYRECPEAWETIDFSSLSWRLTRRLTDVVLSNLLTRVNAREVTKNLNLEDCYEIRGNGILPMQGSRVLESVTISNTKASANPAPFLSVLRTCDPYRLMNVSMDEASLKCDNAQEFLYHLRRVKSLQAQEQGLLCASCHEPVADPSRQVIPGTNGVPLLHCRGCKKDFCRRGCCPVALRECNYCGDTACSTCGTVAQCEYCGKGFCDNDCSSIQVCTKCKKISCFECYDDDSVMVCCFICDDLVCNDCKRRPEACQSEFCALCDDCWKNEPCSVCGDNVCQCNYGSRCGGCSRVVCRKDDCYCHQTIQICWAPVCLKAACLDCETLDECSGCNKNFCKLHKRLVDCIQCSMRHCRACAHVKRCDKCDRACYEGCVCLDSRPSKKAKTL